MATDNRLNGRNPLAYIGVNAYSPPNLTLNTRSPTATDSANVAIGAMWINTTTLQAYILLSLKKGVATWVEFTMGGAGSLVSLTTDDAHVVTPTAGNIDVIGSENIHTVGVLPSTVEIFLNNSIILPSTTADGLNGVIFIGSAIDRFLHGYGIDNTFVGDFGGNFTLTGTDNTGCGKNALNALTSGNDCTGVGSECLGANTSGSNNTGCGFGSLGTCTTGIRNTGVGSGAGSGVATGSDNTTCGARTLIAVGAAATAQTSFFGSAAGENNTANQICGFGYQSLTLNTSGTANSAFGWNSLASNLTGTDNSGFGNNALTAHTGSLCSAFGSGALRTNTASGNSAFGYLALSGNSTGVRNCGYGVLSVTGNGTANDITAYGYNTLAGTTGSFNTAIGSGSLTGLLSGTGNLALGYSTGSAYAGAETNNILIGAGQTGVLGESDVTRIGVLGNQTLCFIAGIFGVTVGGSGVAVVIDNTGKLGTVVSSIKFKENIEDIDLGTSLHALRPVRFNYINAEDKSVKNYGLIAEEVLEVMPELVVYDNYKEPYSVKYHELPILLLKEIQDMNKKILALTARVAELENCALAQ
jgi:trimeric autotransporter adhesin